AGRPPYLDAIQGAVRPAPRPDREPARHDQGLGLRMRRHRGDRALAAYDQLPPEEAGVRGAHRPGAARRLGLLLAQPQGVEAVVRRVRHEGEGAMTEDVREEVRERYARAAAEVTTSEASCCDGPCSKPLTFGSTLYTEEERRQLPEEAVLASLGCGNPTAVAELMAGET